MNKRRHWAAMTLMLIASGSIGCNATVQRPGMQIAPQADEVLKRMSMTLAKVKSFSFESSVVADRPSATGQLVQTSRHSKVLVSRPGKAFAEVIGDDGDYAMWCNAGQLTLLDKSDKVYARIHVPKRIDKMLDYLADKYDATIPLADLLFPDPYAVLAENVESGVYLGLHELSGRKCHHLLFTQANVDWQIWIDDADALPRKVVIVHKGQEGSPQFVAVLDKWNLSVSPPADAFIFAAPQGSKEVTIDDMLKSRKGNDHE